MRRDFLDLMYASYYLDEDSYFCPETTWVDIGVEDVPTKGGVTLLRKTECLEEWARGFCDPEQKARYLTVSRFPFALTRDAGSISVAVGPNSTLHRLLAYQKAYNLNKEQYSTPLKGHTAFGNRLFEALGFSQGLIDRCAEINRRGRSAVAPKSSHIKKATLLHTWERAKQRTAIELETSTATNASFGIRSECRTLWQLFQHYI